MEPYYSVDELIHKIDHNEKLYCGECRRYRKHNIEGSGFLYTGCSCCGNEYGDRYEKSDDKEREEKIYTFETEMRNRHWFIRPFLRFLFYTDINKKKNGRSS